MKRVSDKRIFSFSDWLDLDLVLVGDKRIFSCSEQFSLLSIVSSQCKGGGHAFGKAHGACNTGKLKKRPKMK